MDTMALLHPINALILGDFTSEQFGPVNAQPNPRSDIRARSVGAQREQPSSLSSRELLRGCWKAVAAQVIQER
jgi:hypothetical protein